MRDKYINIGKIVGTHGLKGEIKVVTYTDFIDERFSKGNTLLLIKDDSVIELTVKKYRFHKNMILVTFEEINHINEAEVYRNCDLVLPKSEYDTVKSDKEDEFHFQQLLGCVVKTVDGQNIGEIKNILKYPANDVFVVLYNDKEILIPFIKHIVKTIDIENKIITIEWLEGLE